MPYEVTATRKRPQGFEQLVGQDFVVSTLKSSVELGRIAHAYLFAGPRGVGKTSAARILAKALNCAHGPTPNPCGVCDQCREIARGNSLDVIEIDGASNTSVNDVRELKDEVLFAPNSGRYKAYIIDEVHMLSNSAFNALLKTIEEPPPYIVFIFATTEIHKVPATIRSRCQQFNFRLIPIEQIKAQLQQVVEDMSLEAEEEALFWIAKEATGSLRDAYTLFDQIASFSDSQVSLKEIQEKLGLVGIDSIGEMMEMMADGRSAHVISMAEDVLAKGVSVEQFIIDLAEYFRTLLFLKHGIEREALLGYHPDRFPAKVREAFTTSQLEYAIEQLLILYRDIRYSLNQRFEMELMLSKLSALREHMSSREMMAKIRELRAELAGEESAPSDSQAAGQSAPGRNPAAQSSAPSTSASSSTSQGKRPSAPSSASASPSGAAPASFQASNSHASPASFQASASPSASAEASPSSSSSASAEAAAEAAAQKKSPLNNSVSGNNVHPLAAEPAAEEVRIPEKWPEEKQQGPEPAAPHSSGPRAEPHHEASRGPTAVWPDKPEESEKTEEPPAETAEEYADASASANSDARTSEDTGEAAGASAAPDTEVSAPSPKIHRLLAAHEIEKVIEEVKQSPTLASTLGKVCTWKVEGDHLRLSCDSNYAMRKLKEDVAVLKEKISEVLGTRLEIKVEVQDTSLTAEEEHQSRDDQVELVKKVFRGEIVDGVE